MFEWLTDLFAQRAPVNALGDRGENMAARFLRNHGYKIILRNFRCEVGEIDIIAKDGKTLVFVEVKTRADDEPTPEEQVEHVKQHQVTKAAKFYLARYGVPQPPARFDVVAIVWPTGPAPISATRPTPSRRHFRRKLRVGSCGLRVKAVAASPLATRNYQLATDFHDRHPLPSHRPAAHFAA